MTYVTIGGVTVGLMILAWFLTNWWPGLKPIQKDPVKHASALLLFLLSWAYGALTVLGIGGLIGWAARSAVWITSWLGDVALVWGVGVDAGQRAGGQVYLPLTQTGGALVLIFTVIVTVAAKRSSKHGSAISRGAWCGMMLGTSAGVAGFAAVPLASAANWLGGAVYGVIV